MTTMNTEKALLVSTVEFLCGMVNFEERYDSNVNRDNFGVTLSHSIPSMDDRRYRADAKSRLNVELLLDKERKTYALTYKEADELPAGIASIIALAKSF